MLDLIRLWQGNIAPGLSEEKVKIARNAVRTKNTLDDDFIQLSIEFTEPPHIIFVKDIATKEPANYYNELPSVPLNQSEEKAIEETLRKFPLSYDGDHILIAGIIYDETSNKLYLEAKQVKYSFIRTLSLRKFPENSQIYQQHLYKTGVLVPFITNDDYTIFIERAKEKIYSATSGFLERPGLRNDRKLFDLVTYTAIKETIEEFLGDTDNPRFEEFLEKFEDFPGDFDNFLADNPNPPLRVTFSKPTIKSLLFRTSMNKEFNRGFIEFVTPCDVDCCKEAIEYIIKNNRAKDHLEHTKQLVAVPLDAISRKAAVDFLKQGAFKYPGTFLYHTMLLSAANMANRLSPFIPKELPFSKTKIVPMQSLKLFLQVPRLLLWQKKKVKETSQVILDGEDPKQSAMNSFNEKSPKNNEAGSVECRF